MLDLELTDAAPPVRVLLAVARDAVRRTTPSPSGDDGDSSDGDRSASPADSPGDDRAPSDATEPWGDVGPPPDEAEQSPDDGRPAPSDAGSASSDARSAPTDSRRPPGDGGPSDSAADSAPSDGDAFGRSDASGAGDGEAVETGDAVEADEAAEASEPADDREDWRALRDLARRHAFEPLCYRYLEQRADAGDALPLDGDLPPTVREDLAAAAGSTARQNERLADVLGATWRVLDDAGVRALAVKGPVLATVAYDDLGLRRFDDLDFLVAPADVPDAVAALREAGYALETELGPFGVADLPDGDGGLAAPTSVQLRAPETDVLVDLVYRHADVAGDAHLDVPALWRARSTVTVGDRELPALSPTDRLVVLALHGTAHGWERLLDLTDLAAVASGASADWADALSRATDRDARPDLLLGALLAAEVLDAPLPAGVLGAARADDRVEPVARGLERRFVREPAYRPSSFANHRLRARLYGDAPRRTVRVLSSPTLDDYALCSLPPSLWPCYRLVVPVRLALQALRER